MLEIQYQAGCGIRTARTRLREMAGQPYRSEEIKRRRFVMRCRYTTTSVSPIEPPPAVGFAARQARPPRPDLDELTPHSNNAAETPLPRPARHPTSSAGPPPRSHQAATGQAGNWQPLRKPRMSRFALCAVGLLAAVPVVARAQSGSLPPPPSYAINPPVSGSPLQQQILRNYRSDLLQTQRELTVQNPSGVNREQIEVTRQLNAVNPALPPTTPSPLPAPGASPPAPFQLR